MNRFRRLLRFDTSRNGLPIPFARRQTEHTLKTSFLSAIRTMAPTLLALSLTSMAHAQGTMDFSGATTLMTTFNYTVLREPRRNLGRCAQQQLRAASAHQLAGEFSSVVRARNQWLQHALQCGRQLKSKRHAASRPVHCAASGSERSYSLCIANSRSHAALHSGTYLGSE